MEDSTHPGRLGAYRIDAELSHSTTSSVYKAYEESLKRPVLIKKLHPQMAREDDIRNRFAREAQVCAQLAHENIVSIYAYYSDPDLSMLVMEYVDGLSLGDLIRQRGAVDWKIAVAVFIQILKGLAFAHSKGVIHRDIKPDNILISKQGQVKITDFGLAAIEDAPRLTRQGTVVGTPAYMPPEQISGEDCDARSDLFSLGASLYELITSISPFRGDSFPETIKLILNAQPAKPSFFVPDLPLELDQVILRLLEKRPTRRFATADQTREEVQRIAVQYQLNLDSETIRNYLSLAEPVPIKGSGTTPTSVAIKRRRSRIRVTGVAVFSILLILIIAGVLLRTPPTPVNSPLNQDSSLVTNRGATIQPESGLAGMSKSNLVAPEPIPSQNTHSITTEPREQVKPPIATKTTHQPISLDTTGTSHENINLAAQAPGQLIVTCTPWAEVSVDQTPYGQTPIVDPIALPPGEHQVVLRNDQFPAPAVEMVTITPGQETNLNVDLYSYFALVRVLSVKPWAEIFVDGISYGETPLARPIILPFGSHVIELKNPDFQVWRETVELTNENKTHEISVDLQPATNPK